jgi:glycine cleavage system H protein
LLKSARSKEANVNYPANYKYTKDHEWIKIEEGSGTVGITYHAQNQLGDVVFVELPEVGKALDKGDVWGVVESVKAVVDCYMPVSGTVIAVNDELTSQIASINSDPHGEGWMIKISVKDMSEAEDLMDARAYAAYLAEITE